MKKYLKKSLTILLVATSFNFLSVVGKASSNILTYAQASENPLDYEYGPTESIDEPEHRDYCDDYDYNKCDSFCYEDKKFGEDTLIDVERCIGLYLENVDFSKDVPYSENVIYKDLPFVFDKKFCDKDPKFCNSSSLKSLFQKAKDKIYETLGLNYTDKMENPIIVESWLSSNGYFSYKTNDIHIEKDHLFDGGTLPHEMTHALLSHTLGENHEKLNKGLNEGLATQNNNLGDLVSPFKPHVWLPSSNDDPLFWKFRGDYEKFHYLVNNWIKAEGKDVIKKLLEDVKAGKDSVQAFLDLSGDKVVEKFIEDSKAVNAFLDLGGDKVVKDFKVKQHFESWISYVVAPIFKFLRKLF